MGTTNGFPSPFALHAGCVPTRGRLSGGDGGAHSSLLPPEFAFDALFWLWGLCRRPRQARLLVAEILEVVAQHQVS